MATYTVNVRDGNKLRPRDLEYVQCCGGRNRQCIGQLWLADRTPPASSAAPWQSEFVLSEWLLAFCVFIFLGLALIKRYI